MANGALVVDLQTDLLDLTTSRIVAPLDALSVAAGFTAIAPVVEVAGRRYVVEMQALAAVRRTSLCPDVGDLRDARDALFRALDILTHGF